MGLGKTIEAGLVARQHLIDNPATRVVIAVPEHLRGQWKKELTVKLRLDQFEDAFDLRVHEEIASITEIPDVLIIDEAHHVVGATEGPLADAASRLQQLSRESRVLLLLSATPALSDHRRFLALLNLLDPLSHPLTDVDGFAIKLQNRREFGRLLLSLDPTGPALVLRQRAAEAAKLFPDDPVVAELAPLLIEASRTEPERVASLCTALRTHIADTYRIHQRLIRSRRADAKGWEFMPRGPAVGQEPDLSHVRQEIDDDDRINGLLAALEEWRFAALDTVPASERPRLVQLAERYRSWVEALGISLPEFAAVIALAGTGFLLVTSIYVMLATGFAMLVPELFPTRYRLRGTAVCATAGRIATALVQYAVVAIFAWQGLTGVLTTLAGILVFQAVVFLIFGFETKGRSLENASAVGDALSGSTASVSQRPANIGV